MEETEKIKTAQEVMESSPYDRGVALIEHQEAVVEALVQEWNQIIEDYENKTIMFSIKVMELMKGYPDKTISEIIEKVRNHPKLLQPAHSKDRIMQGVRLIKERKDLIEWKEKTIEEQKALPFIEKPYRKRDGKIFWEFYFQLYKYDMDPGIRAQLEEDGKQDLWSVRKLKSEIGKIMEEKRDPNTARRFKKRDEIREIVIMLKCLEPQDLIMIKEVIKEQFNIKLEGYRQWLNKKEELL